MMRVGHGYDVHRLTEGRPLILGGVKVPYDRIRYRAGYPITYVTVLPMFGAAG